LVPGFKFYTLLFGTTVLLISMLATDSILIAIDSIEIVDAKQAVNILFKVFTVILTVFEVILTIAYVFVYYLIYKVVKLLPESLYLKIRRRMNAFFCFMIIIMVVRTVYYISRRFWDFRFQKLSIDSNELIPFYIEESLFNFVVLYNAVLKNMHNT